MREISTLPAFLKDVRKSAFGAINFAFFEDSSGSEEELLQATRAAIPRWVQRVDLDRLRVLGNRVITEDVFFGSHYNRQRRRLIPLGTAYRLEEPGTGEGFARAFSAPPYGMGRTTHQHLEAAFNEIRDFMLPPWHEAEIRNWASPQLVEVSDFFNAGMEWWGVFLFTVYVPSLGRLSAIAVSASD